VRMCDERRYRQIFRSSDGWAKCVKEEKLKTSDTIKRQMCARM